MADADATTALHDPRPTLKPADGRFGWGPSKVRPSSSRHLAAAGAASWAPRTARSRSSSSSAGPRGLRELFSLPDGYEVVLGNGGTTAFWDAATFGLVRERALHLTFGEFSSKFAP